MKATLKTLEGLVGSLANPSKMPGYAWGIPAIHCKRGSKLREKEGTVCSKCYAMKGRYGFPNVQDALERRLEAFNRMSRQEWVEAMVALISRKVKPEDPYFRVFDSGDLQSEEMLNRWDWIALTLPRIKFWMATRERAVVKRFYEDHVQPANLVIRVSADMIGGKRPDGFRNYSAVSPRRDKLEWVPLVKANSRVAYRCPAPLQGNECGSCRACWDHKVKTVVYLEH